MKRHKNHIPNYREVKLEGGTISSGLIEKANDVIVANHMKDGIMRWTREGADPVILHRTSFINQHARDRAGSYAVAFCHNFVQ